VIADIYARKSTADEGRSAASQERDCRADVLDQGWSVGRVFSDPDKSASRYATKARPDWGVLMAHIAAGGCQVLVLWESSRGDRTLASWATFLDACRTTGTLVRVSSHGRTYDPRVRRDWKVLAEDGIDSDDESQKISERTRRGKRAAAAQGRPSGQTPYGYTRVYGADGRLTAQPPHEERAEIVREIFRRVDAGEAVTAVARALTERGVPAPEGGAWPPTTIIKLATNRRYIGRVVHLGQDVGPGMWPALVDVDLFDRVVARLTDPGRRTQRGTELRWLLSGVPRCGRCATGLLRTWRQAGGARRYMCNSCKGILIQAEPLDELVESAVLGRLRRPDALTLFVPQATGGELAEARGHLAALRKRHDDHIQLAAAGELSAAGLAGVEQLLLPQIDRAERRVRALSLPAPLAHLADVDVAATWGALTVQVRRDVVRHLVDLIVGPAVRGRARFDRGRLAESRWHGDNKTWGEIWKS
jgi:site-specific DNA recombinase